MSTRNMEMTEHWTFSDVQHFPYISLYKAFMERNRLRVNSTHKIRSIVLVLGEVITKNGHVIILSVGCIQLLLRISLTLFNKEKLYTLASSQ